MFPEHPDQRSYRPWAIIKDEILEEFLPVYVSSMIKRRKIPFLIDGFAGPGVYSDGSIGSPMIMLSTTYGALKGRINELSKVVFAFMEREEDLLLKLKEHVQDFLSKNAGADKAKIYYYLGDSEEDLKEIATFIEDQAVFLSPFLYLDPWGLKGVGSDLVFKFLALRKKGIEVEILLRFPPSDVYRFYKNPRLGEGWIRKLVGDFELSELRPSLRNFEILKSYLSIISSKYKSDFNMDLYHVSIEVPGSPPYYMVFFTENPYGCYVMANAMIKGLREYSMKYFPLLGVESLQDYIPNKEEVKKFLQELKSGGRNIFKIEEILARY